MILLGGAQQISPRVLGWSGTSFLEIGTEKFYRPMSISLGWRRPMTCRRLVVSLLYLDFDLRAPTAKALELFLPRMPVGVVVAVDEVNVAEWPGETLGLLA